MESDAHNLDGNDGSCCIGSSGSLKSAGGVCLDNRLCLLAFGDSEKSECVAQQGSVRECTMLAVDSGLVWAPDEQDGFKLGRIVDIGGETVTVLLNGGTQVTEGGIYHIPQGMKWSSLQQAASHTSHFLYARALIYLNEATLFNNIKVRYNKDKIYTYVANILIAVNPYFEMPQLYSSETIRKYQGKSLGVLPPHVFAIGAVVASCSPHKRRAIVIQSDDNTSDVDDIMSEVSEAPSNASASDSKAKTRSKTKSKLDRLERPVAQPMAMRTILMPDPGPMSSPGPQPVLPSHQNQ
ncbi:hypothetical protein HPB50_002460 [Hyalomma asiaticum]|uniref:Uncharacterized protein n=1 Tax=Hyalomma asiaticum TaxID=266040 RepID=A0ACB7S2I5_HYAAI|nr:hypothetical protein HPB50_002460 [Hyalomma asiaticum]